MRTIDSIISAFDALCDECQNGDHHEVDCPITLARNGGLDQYTHCRCGVAEALAAVDAALAELHAILNHKKQ